MVVLEPEPEDRPLPAPLWWAKGTPRNHLPMALCPMCGEPVAGISDHECPPDSTPDPALDAPESDT
jgi:hypothetical protein